uniref:(northern house mosquito) hypothetical protein n=1 Tax=Culex pipiens TaxID=7175 RepID=A0A8D8NEC6_CULPI
MPNTKASPTATCLATAPCSGPSSSGTGRASSRTKASARRSSKSKPPSGPRRVALARVDPRSRGPTWSPNCAPTTSSTTAKAPRCEVARSTGGWCWRGRCAFTGAFRELFI